MALRIDIDGKVYRLPRRIPASVMRALVQWGRVSKSLTLYKSATEAGYRWITVHPQGEESGGMPVKIKVNPDGTGTVVAGAGGSLNAMKLTKLKSPDEWRLAARKRREAQKQREKDLPASVKDAKREAAEKIAQAKAEADARLIATVAEAQGWEESVAIDEETAKHMPADVKRRIEGERQRDALRKVNKLVDAVMDEVVNKQSVTVASELGEVALGELDTSAQRDTSGLGYVDSIVAKAEDAGLLDPEAREKAVDTRIKAFEEAYQAGYCKDPQAAEDAVQGLIAGAAQAREADRPYREEGMHRIETPEGIVDPTKIKDVLLARQQHKAEMADIRKKERELTKVTDVDEALEIAKGVSLVVGKNVRKRDVAELEAALESDIQQKAMEQSMTRLLSTIEDLQENNPAAAPAEVHVNTGRYAEMMDISQGILQEPCSIDRLVADHLGTDASANLMANLFKQRFDGATLRALRQALEQQHVETQARIATEAADKAQELILEADSLVEGLNLADCDADDLLMVQELNRQRQELLDEAAATLGDALGRLEFIGTLNFAMQGDGQAEIKASLGQIATKDAHLLAAALGLEPHEHEIVNDIGNKYLRIEPGAEAKLTTHIAPEVGEEYRAAVSIKRGDQDEDGWLPQGFRDPSEDIVYPEAEEAFSFQRDLALQAGMTPDQVKEEAFDFLDRALADNPYNPRAVRREATTQAFVSQNVPQDLQRAYNDALVAYFPPDTLDSEEQAAWYADRTQRVRQAMIHRGEIAEDVETLGAQTLILGDLTENAVHAALSEMPEAALAFAKVTSENRPQVQAALRDYFWQHLTTESREEATASREAARQAQARAQESAGFQTNIFGEQVEVQRGESEYAPTETEPDAWQRFVASFASVSDAHKAVHEHMQGAFMERFAQHYAGRTRQSLKLGTKQVSNWDRFEVGTADAATRQALLDLENEKRARLGANVSLRDEKGRFLTGERRSLVDELLQRQRNAHQASFGFDFGDGGPKEDFRPRSERVTLGEGVEGQLAKIMPTLAGNFRPGQKVDLPPAVAMDGDYAAQQRAIKLIEQQGRVGVHAGVGSGKTLVGLGAFTHLHKQGKASRAIYAVPSVVAGQFASEALRFLEPSSADGSRGYRWHLAAGRPRSERLRMYKDPSHEMVFVTHQALRDDIVYEMAQSERFNGDPDPVTAAAAWMKATPEAERRQVVQDTLREAGWSFDYSMIDEGHDLLNRTGKPNSVMANALDDFTAGHQYHVNATGTPVKNDVSEAFDILHKLRPDRYPQSRRKEFMRRYSLDTKATREAMQREMAPYVYATKITPDTEVTKHDDIVSLSEVQSAAYRDVLAAYRAAQSAAPGSPEHVAAMRKLAPQAFKGASDEDAVQIATERGRAAGMLRDLALHRIQTASDEVPVEHNAKLQQALALAEQYRQADDDGGQLPGIIFAHNIASCKALRDALKAKGYRVGYLTGQQQSTDKEVARYGFHPPIDTEGMTPQERAAESRKAAKCDILVASDAAACGANLQRAGWLAHYDQPMTAKTHEQRTGRMARIGQQREQVHVHNLIADTPLDHKNHRRVQDKYELAETYQEATELLDDTGRAGTLRSLFHGGIEEDARKITGTQEQAWPEGRAAE